MRRPCTPVVLGIKRVFDRSLLGRADRLQTEAAVALHASHMQKLDIVVGRCATRRLTVCPPLRSPNF